MWKTLLHLHKQQLFNPYSNTKHYVEEEKSITGESSLLSKVAAAPHVCLLLQCPQLMPIGMTEATEPIF
jgi:hypothetical protein